MSTDEHTRPKSYCFLGGFVGLLDGGVIAGYRALLRCCEHCPCLIY